MAPIIRNAGSQNPDRWRKVLWNNQSDAVSAAAPVSPVALMAIVRISPGTPSAAIFAAIFSSGKLPLFLLLMFVIVLFSFSFVCSNVLVISCSVFVLVFQQRTQSLMLFVTLNCFLSCKSNISFFVLSLI